jgi:hypothetical protein
MDESNVAVVETQETETVYPVVTTQGVGEAVVTSIVTPAGEGVYVKGEWCTPETHAWRDGAPILRVDGTAKKKPGRSGPRTDAPVVKAPKAPRLKVVKDDAPTQEAVEAPPVRAVQQKALTAVVSKTFGKIGVPEDTDETIEVRTFVTAPATVEIGYGLTLNIGNYESARVDVKVSVPCYREEVDAAYDFAKKWAEDRVRKEVSEVRSLTSSKSVNNNPF